MKCIKNGSKIKRVDDKTAQLWVNTKGWSYTSKEEWKKDSRKNKVEDVVGTVDTTETVAEKVHGLKAKDRKKANKRKKK